MILLWCCLYYQFEQPDLNKFVSLGKPAWKEARATLQKLLSCTIQLYFVLFISLNLYYDHALFMHVQYFNFVWAEMAGFYVNWIIIIIYFILFL